VAQGRAGCEARVQSGENPGQRPHYICVGDHMTWNWPAYQIAPAPSDTVLSRRTFPFVRGWARGSGRRRFSELTSCRPQSLDIHCRYSDRVACHGNRVCTGSLSQSPRPGGRGGGGSFTRPACPQLEGSDRSVADSTVPQADGRLHPSRCPRLTPWPAAPPLSSPHSPPPDPAQPPAHLSRLEDHLHALPDSFCTCLASRPNGPCADR
jgi:hypothetical protein